METINFTLNERYRKIIDKIKNQAGLTTDQEVLKYLLDDVESQALEPILVEKVNEEQELEEGSSDRIESNMMIYRDEFADDTRILLPITHEDHGLITKGMIDLLHNKIFPVAYVLYDLDYWLKSRNKTWINLEFYRENVSDRAARLADLLSYTEAKHLVDGFPKNLEFYQKSRSTSRMRKSWPKKKKKAEADLMVRRSIDRFGWNFIANNSYEVQGACAEWGFLEITYERGESYIRLNDLGRKFVSFENDVIKNMVKFTVGEQEGGTDLLNNSSGLDTLPNDWITTAINFDFSEKEVEFLMKNVFRKYPLEVDAMKMMLGIGSFGNEEVSGAEILKNEFWKLQEDYLKETVPKMLEEQMAKKIEENIFLRKDKFNPKTRALSVMSRLREMGLFKKDGKTIYNITERGRLLKDILE